MKIKDGFVLAEVAGEWLAVPAGASEVNSRVIMRLNVTGRMIWQEVAAGKTAEEIAAALTEHYDVDKGTALEKTKVFLEKLAEVGVLEIE